MTERWNPLLALEFLTIIRLRRWSPAPVEALARAQAYYPLVGLLLGGILILADAAAGTALPEGPRAALLLVLLAAMTRGFHLDGLADTFDGLLGGGTVERRLEIMRDPRIGSFGATALMLVLLVQWSCLAALSGEARRPGLLLFPALGRLSMVVAVALVPYARRDGLGAHYHEVARGAPLWIAAAAAVAASVVLFGVSGLLLLAVAGGCGAGMALWSWRRIGGATGDVYGAACVVAEAGVLLALVAGAGQGVIRLGDWW